MPANSNPNRIWVILELVRSSSPAVHGSTYSEKDWLEVWVGIKHPEGMLPNPRQLSLGKGASRPKALARGCQSSLKLYPKSENLTKTENLTKKVQSRWEKTATYVSEQKCPFPFTLIHINGTKRVSMCSCSHPFSPFVFTSLQSGLVDKSMERFS